MRRLLRRLVNLIGSPRLTLALLLGVATLLLVGLAVPQKRMLQRELYEQWRGSSPTLVTVLEVLGLTDVYRSPMALVLWGAFFLNLAVVMVRRVPAAMERTRIDGVFPSTRTGGFLGPLEVEVRDGIDLDAVGTALRRRGWAVLIRDDRLLGVKCRYSALASIAFHLSFFLVAAGGATSYFTRFEGNLDLGQGEEFTGDLTQYSTPPILPRCGGPPAARFSIEGIEPLVDGDVPAGVKIWIRDDSMLQRTIEVNRPYDSGTASFVFRTLGVAPLIVVHDAAGQERFGGLIRLDILGGRTDEFGLLGQKFQAEFFPDYTVDGDVEGTRSQRMRDPVLRLTVSALSGRKIAASLRPGDSMAVGPYRLTFVDWRWWVRLYVRSERGLGVIWTGFALACAAAVARLLYYRREVLAEWAPGGRTLRIYGRAEYYRVLFHDELEAVVSALRAEVGIGAAGDVTGVER